MHTQKGKNFVEEMVNNLIHHPIPNDDALFVVTMCNILGARV